jgi:hypothetical protein
MADVASTKYRWRMSRGRRVVRVALLAVIALFFLPGAFDPQLDLWWRVVSGVGLITSVLAIRTLLGAVLIVRDEGLRLQKTWPRRRDIPWYRILATDVVPGFWNLEIELNSGERVELPPVADLNALYDDIERHRTALDA